MACKAVNDSSGPNGLIPTLLVYGAFPRMSELDAPNATQAQRTVAVKNAMAGLAKVRAKTTINSALSTRNGPDVSSVQELPINSQVIVFREKGGWKGPYLLKGITGTTCHLELPSGLTDFRATHVKEYLSPDQVDEEAEEEPELEETEGLEAEKNNSPSKDGNADPRRGTRIRAPKKPFFFSGSGDVYFTDGMDSSSPDSPDICIYLAEHSFEESRQKEIDGLLESGVFRMVDISEVPEGTRVFNSRFVDQLKFPGTENAMEKSRLVIQAYNDQGKLTVLTQSPTIQRSSQRIILALAPSFPHLLIYSRDITQAYTQALSKLYRLFYAKPPKEMKLPPNIVMLVLKPLYGIPESGNHWFKTYHDHHTVALGMEESTYDPCLLSCGEPDSDMFAVLGMQVDDTLFLATTEFAKKEETELKRAGFAAKDRDVLTVDKPMKFNGGLITLLENGSITLTQEKQSENLALVRNEPADMTSSKGEIRKNVSPKEQYVAQRARGAYIATVCQPEASFDYSFAAQSYVPGKETEAVKLLNERIQWQLENPERGLTFVPLKMSGELRVVVFTDASFANLGDHTSQIGFVTALVDEDDNANILHYSSIKCKRVTRAVLASELYGMVHGFDYGVVIKTTLEKALKKTIPLVICTDSNSLYECLVKLGTTAEKRLMIDIMCLRQAYERRLIAEIVWIGGPENPADAMTKSKSNGALCDLIDTNKVNLATSKWVKRPTGDNSAGDIEGDEEA